jgi:tetratricopeptide (TPR) repeat protein
VALLHPEEQVLFRRLAVFVGGGTLEAIEAVCLEPEGGDSQGIDLLDGLGALVDQGLLQRREEGGELRFGMLHVIHEFAQEQLAAGGEAEVLRRAHAAYYLSLAEQLEPDIAGPSQVEIHARLEREHYNLRAVLGWSLDQQAAETAARICVALGSFWNMAGHWVEQGQWLTQTLRLGATLPPRLHARLLHWTGYLEGAHGNYTAAKRHLEESAALFRSLNDAVGLGDSLSRLAGIALDQEHYELAERLYTESVRVARESGDRVALENVLKFRAQLPLVRGDYAAAKKLLEEALAYAASGGNIHDTAWCKAYLGWLALLEGHDAGAEVLLQEALAVQQRLKDTNCSAISQGFLGLLALERGDVARALGRLGESLTLYTQVGKPSGIAETHVRLGYARCAAGDIGQAEAGYVASLQLERTLGNKQRTAAGLAGLAEVAFAQGLHERAARLLGAATQSLASVGAVPLPLPPRLRAEQGQLATHGRQALGVAAWDAAFAAGEALSLDEALAEVLVPGS